MIKKRIVVIGAKGNMGSRYCFYLRYLGCDVVEVDLDSGHTPMNCDGILIATPTENHIDHIRVAAEFNKPILCEKAISKDLKLVTDICEADINLRMINQYGYFDLLYESGATHYNYFRTGNDGLNWDCINIIGIARNEVYISNRSPVWTCCINGRRASLGDMDRAYLWNLQDWLVKEDHNKPYILHAHKKASEWKSE